MKQVKVTEFRARLPEYLGKVQRGESITVLSRGKPVARLIPVNDAMENAREQLVGLRKQARIGDIISPQIDL
jgi:prevent-host-death family protein